LFLCIDVYRSVRKFCAKHYLNMGANMNLYYILEQYNLLDLDNELAASIVSSISQKDIATDDIRTYFREQLLWYWSNPQTMAGGVQTAIDSGALPIELTSALGEMWSSLFGNSATKLLTNSNLEIAKRIFDGMMALISVGVVTSAQCDGFYAFGGGLIAPNTTATDVQQAKDDKAAQDAAVAAEEARLEAESALRLKWDDAMITAGVEEAFHNGNEAALVVAINAAVATMG